MKPTSKSLIQLALMVGIFLMSSAANAYTTHGRWSGNRVTMRAARVSFPAGNAYRSALATAVSRFNNNPSQFRFTQSYDDTSVRFDNGQSEVWFTGDSAYNPAWTFWWNDWWTGRIEEADVVFYNGEAYTTSMTKTTSWAYGGTRRTFQTTLLHEYGHVAGLGHEDGEYNIMGTDWTHIHCNGQTLRSYLGEDACDGLVALYGRNSGSIEDLSVSMFRRTGASGEYSTHGLCRMFTPAGGLLPSSANNGQRRYNVSAGQQVRVEFTYENNGETRRTGRTGYYISTNSYISIYDRLIATSSYNMTRDNVVTNRVTVTIPSDLAPGTYYLGVIIDYDSALAERDEGNNAAYHIIRVL